MERAALAQAQDRANREGALMFVYVGTRLLDVHSPVETVWYVRNKSEGQPEGGTLVHAIEPQTYQTDEHCQYCGNSWQQTRTIGTPRLDAVPCPSCKRLA
jgi:hypothetical protein